VSGAALVESVGEGRGPKELCFLCNPFGSGESVVNFFMNALRDNAHLEELNLPNIFDHQIMQPPTAALHENKEVVHLTVNFRVLDDSGRTELFKAISLHPSLRSLEFKMDIDPKKRREITKSVVDMLTVNERVRQCTLMPSAIRSTKATGLHSRCPKA
jgi:hypothetical protein